MKIPALIAVICLVLACASCGGRDSTTESEGAAAGTQSTATAEQATEASEAGEPKPDEGPKGSSAADPIAGTPKPPNISVPSGPPPDRMIVKELKPGWGPVVKPHSRLAVNFIGSDY